MKVGYCVEGATDEALIKGLRDRWCPGAELVPGRFRGNFRRREIPHACLELRMKGVDVIILMRDANDEDWRDVARADLAYSGTENAHLLIVGVCHRNVECWLVSDSQYAASFTGYSEQDFRVADPKNAFERAMNISTFDRKTDELVDYVQKARLAAWLANASFENFYEQLWQKSKVLGCTIENLRDSGRR